MAKRFRDTEIWKKSFYKKLTPAYKLFWNFITDDCSHSGIWDVEDLDIITLRIGEKINLDTAIFAFNEDEKRVHVFDGGKKWFIIPFVTFQYGDLNPNNRLHESVRRELEIKNLLALIPVRGPLDGGVEAPKELDKELEKEKKGIVKGKPTLEEAKALFREKGFPAEAEKFFDYYEANGWRVGKNPMKSWTAAVANWLRNGKSYGNIPVTVKREKKKSPTCTACEKDGYLPERNGRRDKCWCWQ